MRVLLTGVAGFVGSHLADRLLAEGCEVVGVDNLLTGRRANVSHLARNPRFKLLIADASDSLKLAGRFDWLLHFAGPASPRHYLNHPVETLRVNGEGTLRLLELASRMNAAFMYASSSEVYGDPDVHPQPESYHGNVNPSGPRSVYQEAKRYGEALSAAYLRSRGVSVRICRIFNTYGPRMDVHDGRVVSSFVSSALRGEPLIVHGDGSQTRSFQYVDDLTEGIRRLMDADYGGPVNLGRPEETTVGKLAELVIALSGSSSAIVRTSRPLEDPRRRCPDIALSRELLGWEPTIPLRVGLSRIIESLRAEMATSTPIGD